jgi:hypothetical protein
MRKVLYLVVALAAGSSNAAYRCVDEKGVTHIGDTPPAACARVPLFEVSPSGNVLRKIDPTPTAEEAKTREAEAADRKEKEKQAAEQRRKDIALMATYSSTAEVDMARDRNVEPVQARIRLTQERIAAVEKRAAEIADEMEFYKAGKSKSTKKVEMPAQLTADNDRVQAEKAALQKSVAASEKEIAEIRARFDSDKKRFVELKANPGLVRNDANAPSTAVPLNWSRGSAKCGDKTLSCRRGESFLCLKTDGTWHTVACEPPRSY